MADLFSRHRELMEKYNDIEAYNGCQIPVSPYNLDARVVQGRIKDMFWRVTEELSEAVEAIEGWEHKLTGWKESWDSIPAIRHFFEELSDALHFLVEASILANLQIQDVERILIIPINVRVEHIIYTVLDPRYKLLLPCSQIIFDLGIAANDFKNKPWKQTEVITDTNKFKQHLLRVWASFGLLLRYLDCTMEDVYNLYNRKWQVNRWRQNTQY